MKELLIDAKTENLDTVLEFINRELEEADYPAKLSMQITVAVEEIFVNIAHYAYNPDVGGAVIRIFYIKDEIVIEFEDSGTPYNPLENEAPDINAGAERRKIGGLGIFMVKKIMDSIKYEYKDGKNILTISKKCLQGEVAK
ncbi:MAG: ATP-binding protein [Oscillospiraceae bacterium]|nr:ATP-binding protein [Oscillospiraceae bacterium]